jgi:hypothetical protein
VSEEASSAARPPVVARRWDQLGSRLGAIINGRVLAEVEQLAFRLEWPRGPERSVEDPLQLFSQPFLDEVTLRRHELDGRRCVTYHELIGLAPADRRMLLARGSRAFLDMNELFGVVGSDGDGYETAQRRYRRCFDELGWNDETRALIELTQRCDSLRGLAGVHVRAGDIVSGPWRHAINHEKYVPTPYVLQTLSVFTGEQRPTLVVSDNGEYLAELRARFPQVLTAAELLPGTDRLTEAQRVLVELLALSRCDPIVGPPASAFSKLAANLGSKIVARADTLSPRGEEREVLLAGIAAVSAGRKPSRLERRLTARDICWLLDVFADTLSLDEQRALAKQAAALDRDFCAALSHRGRTAALVGRPREAVKATARAIMIAEQVERHDDPLFEALASDILARCLAWKHDPAAVHESYERLSRLKPFWFKRDRILRRLSDLITVADDVSALPHLDRLRTARRLRRGIQAEADATDAGDGLAQHRSVLLFDPLAYELDRVARYLDSALREACQP